MIIWTYNVIKNNIKILLITIEYTYIVYYTMLGIFTFKKNSTKIIIVYTASIA